STPSVSHHVVARSPDRATGPLSPPFGEREAGSQTTPLSAPFGGRGQGEGENSEPTLSPGEIEMARAALIQVRVSALLQQYIIELICATRDPYRFGSEVGDLIRVGASPRGTIALAHAARAAAFLCDRDYATPDD